MKFSAKLASLLFGVITFSVAEIDLVNVPTIIGRTVNFSTKVSAQSAQVYVPPEGPIRTSRTEGTGSRGCENSDTKLQLLVPNDHLPLTVSARPTFFWYVSDTKLLVRFTLVEPGVADPIVDRTFKVKRSGIVPFELPSDVPGLVLGKEYRWTVSLVCNKERPSENTYADSSIKRIAITPELAQTLAEAGQEPQKRSLVYARSGIWYDALNSSHISYQANPQSKVTFWYFSKLLTQIGLPIVSNRQLHQPNSISSQ